MVGNQAYTQIATLWTNSVMDGYGERSYSAPVTINVRWQQELKLMLGKDGEQTPCVAQLWLQQQVNVGDYLALGDYTADSDAGEVADPTTVDRAYIVFDYQDIPSVLGTDRNRKALMRAK